MGNFSLTEESQTEEVFHLLKRSFQSVFHSLSATEEKKSELVVLVKRDQVEWNTSWNFPVARTQQRG
ncbi:hypothetical protein Q5P01_023579 [Channa striata]|uniref:Uncharacterized protein n=1 Tax=Channa striata TaxID=64152 RepID=A0AA88IV36_CHASR|nr:hypothetical protein Q5P01_023579 [Channa striata]